MKLLHSRYQYKENWRLSGTHLIHTKIGDAVQKLYYLSNIF